MKRIVKKHRWAVGVVALACTVLALTALATPKGERQTDERLWLSHFVGDEVVVTFVVAPPNMARAVKAQLMDAEVPGVVLKLRKEEIFFSFANIMAVEPVRR